MKIFLKKTAYFLILFLIILYVLELIIIVNRPNSITNGKHSIVEFNTEELEFDYLFVGDSRVFRGIENFGNKNNLNLGTAGAGHNIINRKLEKILSLNKIETVIIDYEILFKPNSFDWYLKADYLKYMFAKKEDFRKFSNLNGFDYLDFYIPIYRYRNYKEQFVKDFIGCYFGEADKYGFSIKNTKCSDDGSWEFHYSYNFSNYNPTILNTLEKYDIKNIHFIELPYLNFKPSGLSNFDGKSIFRSSSDFERCDFKDLNHFNYYGRKKFSRDLFDYLQKNVKEE